MVVVIVVVEVVIVVVVVIFEVVVVIVVVIIIVVVVVIIVVIVVVVAAVNIDMGDQNKWLLTNCRHDQKAAASEERARMRLESKFAKIFERFFCCTFTFGSDQLTQA